MLSSCPCTYRKTIRFYHVILVILQAPYGYDMVLDDRYTMHDKAFYIPGLSQDQRQQWNKTAPAFRQAHPCHLPDFMQLYER